MKPALKDLQNTFKSHLMRGDTAIAEHIVSTPGLAKDVRLAIYGHAYYARLAEALQQDYEAIHILLGDDDFNLLCKRYIDAYPSKYPSLRWFGQHMNEFLTNNEPYRDYPYLKEMASFEWCFIEAFDAEDASFITIDEVAQLAPEQWAELKFGLHPSVQLFQYNWNILPVWKAATNNEDIPSLIQLEHPQFCLVWRQNLTTHYRTLELDEAEFTNGVRAGENFSQLCERLTLLGIDPEQVPMRAASILKTLLDQGAVSQLLAD
jgi:hypothetical protein